MPYTSAGSFCIPLYFTDLQGELRYVVSQMTDRLEGS